MKRCKPALYPSLATALLIVATGCSKPDERDDTGEIDVTVVSGLFGQGFDQGAAQGEAQPQAHAGAMVDSSDPRAGIPFDRSSRLTRQVEQAAARDLGQLFSLDFAIEDPGEFLTSGRARSVWERELAARGYPADNLAGATALMFCVAWELANRRKLSAADNAAVLRQVTRRLRGDPLERENHEQRQIQADLRLIAAGLWLEEAYLRERYPDQMRELSDAVHRDMQRMTNNDMRTQTVTAEGFSD